MTDRQLHQLLVARVEAAGTMKQVAADIGISAAYLSDIMSYRAEPGPKVLAALGLKRVMRYLPVDEVSR